MIEPLIHSPRVVELAQSFYLAEARHHQARGYQVRSWDANTVEVREQFLRQAEHAVALLAPFPAIAVDVPVPVSTPAPPKRSARMLSAIVGLLRTKETTSG